MVGCSACCSNETVVRRVPTRLVRNEKRTVQRRRRIPRRIPIRTVQRDSRRSTNSYNYTNPNSYNYTNPTTNKNPTNGSSDKTNDSCCEGNLKEAILQSLKDDGQLLKCGYQIKQTLRELIRCSQKLQECRKAHSCS